MTLDPKWEKLRRLTESITDRKQGAGIRADVLLELLDELDYGTRRKSVLQDWVTALGLRHQGVLLTAVRGPDTSPKDDAVKALVRCYRAAVLNAHCGDPAKAKTFIEAVDRDELFVRMDAVIRDVDALPHHYVMHLIHAAEVVGYKCPDRPVAHAWGMFYHGMVYRLHLTPETASEMDARLSAGEEAFAAAQSPPVGAVDA